MNKKTIILIIAMTLFSCSSKLSQDEMASLLKIHLNVEIPADFEVLENEISIAIGDRIITYKVKFDPEVFNMVLFDSRKKNNYEVINSVYQFPKSIDDNETIYILFDTLKYEVKYTSAEF
jgi:hypothetical protein